MYTIKKKYVDYRGNERTEEFCFNLTKAELIEMEMSTTGGMENFLKKIAHAQDTKTLVALFKGIIHKAYGEISDDGRRFIKSEELSNAFEQTEAYAEMFLEFFKDSNTAADFINNIIPSDIREELEAHRSEAYAKLGIEE